MRKCILLLITSVLLFLAAMMGRTEAAQATHYPGYPLWQHTECYDGWDNDSDGTADYRYFGEYSPIPGDPDCTSNEDNSESPGGGGSTPPPPPPTPAACNNGVDDDKDGKTDYSGGDPGCSSATDASEKGTTVCDDGISNDDGDTLIDYRVDGTGDPGCFGPQDTDEGNVAQCSDGVDNDADGKIDRGGVQVWPSGAYAPADDGCDNAWDDTEYLNIGNSPTVTTNANVDPWYYEDAYAGGPYQVLAPWPYVLSPPSNYNEFRCVANVFPKFNNLDADNSWESISSRYWFQCDRTLNTATITMTMQWRYSSDFVAGSQWQYAASRTVTVTGTGPNFVVGSDGVVQSHHRGDGVFMECNGNTSINFDYRISIRAYGGLYVGSTFVPFVMPEKYGPPGKGKCPPAL